MPAFEKRNPQVGSCGWFQPNRLTACFYSKFKFRAANSASDLLDACSFR